MVHLSYPTRSRPSNSKRPRVLRRKDGYTSSRTKRSSSILHIMSISNRSKALRTRHISGGFEPKRITVTCVSSGGLAWMPSAAASRRRRVSISRHSALAITIPDGVGTTWLNAIANGSVSAATSWTAVTHRFRFRFHVASFAGSGSPDREWMRLSTETWRAAVGTRRCPGRAAVKTSSTRLVARTVRPSRSACMLKAVHRLAQSESAERSF